MGGSTIDSWTWESSVTTCCKAISMLVLMKRLGLFEFINYVMVDFIVKRDLRWRYWWIWCWRERHLSVGTGGATLGGEGISYSINLRDAGLVSSGGEPGFSGTLGYTCLVGVGGIGCSVVSEIGVSMRCYVRGGGSCCFSAVLVINM